MSIVNPAGPISHTRSTGAGGVGVTAGMRLFRGSYLECAHSRRSPSPAGGGTERRPALSALADSARRARRPRPVAGVPSDAALSLEEAAQGCGVRDGRLHDARHTAATDLLLLGVHERTIMSVLGWSTTAMASRYTHVITPIHDDLASRLDGLLWSSRDAPIGTN